MQETWVSDMQYTRLGHSEIEVSRMALGCWPFAGGAVWGTQDDADSIAAVHSSLDNGVNFFDTAEGYNDDSNSEAILGVALQGRRETAVVATKVGPRGLHPKVIEEHCDGSLRRLQTDYIDLYQIHWPNHDVSIEDTMSALFKLRDAGKIRVLGVCNFGVDDLGDILDCGEIVTDQLPYNLLWRAIEFEIAPRCVNRGVGIICYSPLAQGLLAGLYNSADEVPPGLARSRHFSSKRELTVHGEEGQEAKTFAAINRINNVAASLGEHPAKISLAWLLHQSGVSSLLVGARNADEVALNIPAFDYVLDEDAIDALSAATAELKDALGDNADMWHSPSRMR